MGREGIPSDSKTRAIKMGAYALSDVKDFVSCASCPFPLRSCRWLSQSNIKQRQPVLNGLQGEAAQDQSYPERAKPSLRQAVGVILDVGVKSHSETGDDSSHQPDAHRKRPHVVHMMNKSTARKCRRNVAEGTHYRPPKLTSRQARAARRGVVEGGAHTPRIGECLTYGDENSERKGEPEPQDSVESDCKSEPTDCCKNCLPEQGIMFQSAGRPIKLNRQGNACCDTGSQPEDQTKAETVSHAEHNGVCDGAGK